jgi:hypothetical protein
MKNPWAHRLAILLALIALIAIVLGACLTSEIRTFPGATTPSTVTAPAMAQAHTGAGYAAIALSVLICWPLLSINRRLSAPVLVWALLAVASIAKPFLHAVVAPIFFALLVSIVVMTSANWQAGPAPVPTPWKPLRALGMLVPILVLLQVALGAAFRHNVIGVVWHILNAFIVLGFALVVGVFVLRQFPDHKALRPAALAFVIVIGIQVLLGFGVYMVLLVSSENNTALIVTGVLHVTNGALTLAAAVVLALQMQRHLIQSGI